MTLNKELQSLLKPIIKGGYQLPFGKGYPQATHRPTEIQGDLLEDFAQEVWEIRVLLSPYLGTYPQDLLRSTFTLHYFYRVKKYQRRN